ncbi:hypothetical protein V9T40_005347 [Parthenolecanium corni]|uniref:Uncharacterized protein n=1 Tax=Parthenolecanium corni TaxID=536013 RepID=A0AAN9TJ08_9HEMI
MSSSGNQDRIEAAQVSAPASGANTPAESNRDVGPRFGRLHSVWRLWNQPLSLPSVTRTSSQEMQSLRQDDEQNVDMEAAPQPPQLTTSFKVQGNFGRKIGLLFGL